MNYKNMIKVSVLISSLGCVLSTLSMNSTNKVQSANIIVAPSVTSRKTRRKMAKIKLQQNSDKNISLDGVETVLPTSAKHVQSKKVKNQPAHNSSVAKHAAVIKTLSASLNKAQVKKAKKPQQQKNSNIQKVQDVVPVVLHNVIQVEQVKKARRRRGNKNQAVQNVTAVNVPLDSLSSVQKVNDLINDVKINTAKFSPLYEFVLDDPKMLVALAASLNDTSVQKRKRPRKKVALRTVPLSSNVNDSCNKKPIVLPASAPLKSVQNKKLQQSIEKNDNDSVTIYDSSHKSEIVLFKKGKNVLSPGTYYRTNSGLKPVPMNLRSDAGLQVVNNHLSHLMYAESVCAKMRQAGDIRHSFSTDVEKKHGHLACVVVKNAINESSQITESKKKFDLYVTMPGSINKIKYEAGKKIIIQQDAGVFEFKVRKNLYEKKGLCLHRFLAPKGTVGSDGFGAKAQNKRIAS